MTIGGPLATTDYSALEARWITREQADAAKLRRVVSIEGGELIGRNGSGDWSGLVIPYYLPGEQHARDQRLRCDHPEMERQPDGSLKEKGKYLSAPGYSNLIYFAPDVTRELLANVEVPLLVVEGEFKCLALSRLSWYGLNDSTSIPRFVPIGLAGVWSWKGTIGKEIAPDGTRVSVKGAIPDLNRIAWERRRTTIIFDADAKDNELVRIARSALTRELQERGAAVHWFPWPKEIPASVKGVDDLLAASGPDFVLHLISTATAKHARRSTVG